MGIVLVEFSHFSGFHFREFSGIPVFSHRAGASSGYPTMKTTFFSIACKIIGKKYMYVRLWGRKEGRKKLEIEGERKATLSFFSQTSSIQQRTEFWGDSYLCSNYVYCHKKVGSAVRFYFQLQENFLEVLCCFGV